MTDSEHFGFAKLVPGFDFLQSLTKGTAQTLPQMPSLSSWVAPTLDVEELEKRIQELRAVHFWLEQNSKALGATIQALEVQKMTLATLKGMNCSMADLAQAMKLTPQTGAAAASAAASKPAKPTPTSESSAASGVVDPLQWWGSLTQQFQHIASTAMQGATEAAQAAQAKAPAAKRASTAPRTARKTAAKPAAKTNRKPVRTSGQ
jgi:hypothetical protein